MTSGNLPIAEMINGTTKPKFTFRTIKKQFPKLAKVLSASVMMGLYILWAILFYGWAEGWSAVDAIYFSAVTMSTVGYGDLSPSDNATSEVITVIFIFFGIVGVFGEVSSCITMLLAPFFKCFRDVLDRRFPMKTIDLDGDGGSDFKVPRGPVIYYTKNLLAPVVVIFFGQNVWAIGYWQLEGWSYRRAWYHCMTTMTTVGYGDVSITTDAGKLYATFHLIFSVSLLGSLIGEIFKLMADRENLLKRAELMAKRLDPELIRSLDKDGGGLDKAEFVLGMLYKLDLVKEEDAAPYLKQFHQLDADGSGVLTSEDIEAASRMVADQQRGKPPQRQAVRPARVTPGIDRIDVDVRRGEAGFGFHISAKNVIEKVQPSSSVEGTNGLKVGDKVMCVDGHKLVDSQGTLVQLKEVFKELQKQSVHTFTVERALTGGRGAVPASDSATSAVPPSPMFLSPTLPLAQHLPSSSKMSMVTPGGDVDLRTSIAYAWGAMSLPREQLQPFMELVAPSGMESGFPIQDQPRKTAFLESVATPGAVQQFL